MRYCFVAKKKVYSCDHANCNAGGSRNYGTKVSGMKYCAEAGKHVYSCDHYRCR